MTTKPRRFITAKQAESIIAKSTYVHTFATPNGMMLGADWPRHLLIKEINSAPPDSIELSGDTARRLNHGVVFHDGKRMLFIETDPKELELFECAGV